MITPPHHIFFGIFLQMFKYILFPLYVIPMSSQLQATPGQSQRIRNPVFNPSMVSPSPDGFWRVSVKRISLTSKKGGKEQSIVVQYSQDGFEEKEENKPSSNDPKVFKPPKKKQKPKKQKKTTTHEAVCFPLILIYLLHCESHQILVLMVFHKNFLIQKGQQGSYQSQL